MHTDRERRPRVTPAFCRLRPLRPDDETAFRGYATEILRQSLVIARANGVDRVLVYCDEDNAGSRAVIESCGKLDCVTAIATQPTRSAGTGSTEAADRAAARQVSRADCMGDSQGSSSAAKISAAPTA